MVHALSDETRLQIIERLSDGEQCVCDLTDMLATTQPPPSRSLASPPARHSRLWLAS
ncbi:MAG: winged helix-turn-helix transcriptional regulator, partial [Candidatus Methylomirabilis oxyfera]|nr:winged helix-turn-helix transcriptional regulator [Candidatus Methylomirabilis oxyfera]